MAFHVIVPSVTVPPATVGQRGSVAPLVPAFWAWKRIAYIWNALARSTFPLAYAVVASQLVQVLAPGGPQDPGSTSQVAGGNCLVKRSVPEALMAIEGRPTVLVTSGAEMRIGETAPRA